MRGLLGLLAVALAVPAHGDGIGDDDFEGSAVVKVVDDGTALRVDLPRALVDPNQPVGTSNAVAELAPVSIENSVDFGRPLLRLLGGATVTNERRETHGGRVAQAFVLRLPPSTDGSVSIRRRIVGS